MKFIDRINSLIKSIDEINREIEVIDKGQKQTLKCLQILLDNRDKKKEFSPTEFKAILDLMKEVDAHELDWFRRNTDLIKICSVDIANKLDKQILDLEKSYRLCQECGLSCITKFNEINMKKFIVSRTESTEQFQSLDKKVKMCKNLIKDTLNRLKDYRLNDS